MRDVAIVDTSLAELVAEGKTAMRALIEAESRETRVAATWEEARTQANRRRLELGRVLVRARDRWPERGPAAKGWGDYLRRVGLEQPRAWELMQLAGYAVSSATDETIPTLVEAGARSPRGTAPTLRLVPPPADESSPGGASAAPPPAAAPDRDTWCTPKRLADAIGKVDLDPCSNERSHIRSRFTYRLDRGEDGLELAHEVPASYRVFINPPYSAGQVAKWIAAYAHTRFCFLLRFDPQPRWFAQLWEHVRCVLVPRGDRVQFEPPPGADESSNQFPHALYYAYAEDTTSAIRRMCLEPWIVR